MTVIDDSNKAVKVDCTKPTVEAKDTRGRLVADPNPHVVEIATTQLPALQFEDDPVEIIKVKKHYNKKKKKAKRNKQKQSRKRNRK